MITNILAGVAIGGIVVFLIYGSILVLIFVVLFRIVKFLTTGNKEQKLMRMEMGKLADQVLQIKDQIKTDKKSNSPTESDL